MKKLTELQQDILDSLRGHGVWEDYNDIRCSWVWQNRYITRRVLDALVGHGYAHTVRLDRVTRYYPVDLLAHCPFCGVAGMELEVWNRNNPDTEYGCGSCEISFDTIEQWNRRVDL